MRIQASQLAPRKEGLLGETARLSSTRPVIRSHCLDQLNLIVQATWCFAALGSTAVLPRVK